MEKNYIMEIANTIRKQIIATAGIRNILSWGIDPVGFLAAKFKEMPSLRFKVNGRLFKGWVLVAYNVMDYYEIWLRDEEGYRQVHPEVYCDEIGSVIGELVEVGTDPEEYEKWIKENYKFL